MIARFGLVLVVVAGLSLATVNDAHAQCNAPGLAPGYGYGYGFGFDVGRLYGVLAQNVPYYAAFPPVYYSAPVPRTYGYSPFAYPPGTATPEIAAPIVAAKEILNPYVPASTSAETETEADKVTQRDSTPVPLAIMNPYVDSSMVGPELHAVAINR
ncbi:MAG: hypothetical protein ACR2NM_00450 [Bythopirellula sp.]